MPFFILMVLFLLVLWYSKWFNYKIQYLMKYLIKSLMAVALALFLTNCQPLTSIQIETLVPSQIDFPGNYNLIVFANLDNDINNDNDIDTILYNMITNEMNLGFLDAIKMSAGVDSSVFLFVKGYPDKDRIYYNDTISWDYLDRLANSSRADIFILLDSLKLSMESDIYTNFYSEPTEYYKFRELSVQINWSVFDLFERKRLDSFSYKDTLFWEAYGYSKSQVESNLNSLEQSIRETAYFAAYDYGKRILPGWKTEVRYYFNTGNIDFQKAADHVYNNNWDDAAAIWEKYVDHIDKEIASRACFNLAVVNEIKGKFIVAIGWAERSNEIKPKTRTRYYIEILKERQQDLEKLEKQLY